MAFSDYSSTPAANTAIAGQNVAPGGPPSAVGPAVRQLMADGRALSDRAAVAYDTINAVSAASTTNLSAILTTPAGSTFTYQAGDFSALIAADPLHAISVAPASAPTGASGAWIRQNVGDIRLAWFGPAMDGVADDTTKWRAAIKLAGFRQARTILVPPGVSLVTDQIVNTANPLPPGLTFSAEGSCADPYSVRSCLRYTGSGTCWSIAYPTGAFATVRGPSFDSITFQTTNPAGTVFDFNDTLTHTPYDNPTLDPYRIIQGVSFRNCLAFGVNGTGDFIRACKTFEMYIDHQTAIYSFRRAVWLKGCDNNDIRARLAGNNRGVMIEFSGSFGNNNKYTARSIQAPDTSFGGEASYAVWDTGSMTTIGEGLLFESGAARAFIYLGGFGTQVRAPQFASPLPCFELAANARECTIHSPRTTTPNPAYAPIVNAPTNWAFGDGQMDYRLTVVDAPYNFRRILAAANLRGRVRAVGSAPHGLLAAERTEAIVPTTKGLLQSVSCSASNGSFWGYGGIGGQPLEGIVQDPLATGGYAIKLSSVLGSGFGLQYQVGVSIQPAQYQFNIRNRLSADGASFVLIATKNGTFLGTLPLNAGMTYGRATPVTIDCTGFVSGDVLGVEIYNNSNGPTAWVDYVDLVPIAD